MENCQLVFVIIVAILNLAFVSCPGKLLAAAKLFDRFHKGTSTQILRFSLLTALVWFFASTSSELFAMFGLRAPSFIFGIQIKGSVFISHANE